MDEIISQHTPAPQELLVPNHVLETDLYLYLPLNKSLLIYRRKGESLSAEDCNGISKIPPENLLILRSEAARLLSAATKNIANAIRAGNLNSPAVRKSAASIIDSIQPKVALDDKPSPEAARAALAEVPKLVEEIVMTFKKTPAVEAYANICQKINANTDPLTAHCRQVSALAVLIMMTLGDATMEELSDIATAGLVHDIGLSHLPTQILRKHVTGDEEYGNAEKLAYFKHIEGGLAFLKESQIVLTPGAHRMIELHHENWDGSGFRALVGNQIYRPARALRIADEVVMRINSPDNDSDVWAIVADLQNRRGKSQQPIFDPKMMELLSALAPRQY